MSSRLSSIVCLATASACAPSPTSAADAGAVPLPCIAAPSPFDAGPLPPAPPAPRLGEPIAIDDFCDRLAGIVCPVFEGCGCPSSGAPCGDRIAGRCEAYFANDDVRDALARGVIAWDGARAGGALDALDDALAPGCAARARLDLSSIAPGLRPRDEPCTDVSGAFTECAIGSCMLADPDAGRTCTRGVPGALESLGAALADLALGARCNPTLFDPAPVAIEGVRTTCRAGLRCVLVCGREPEGVCVPALQLGERCAGPLDCESAACEPGDGGFVCTARAPGRFCSRAAECGSGDCDRGRCSGTALAGEPCTRDPDCRSGLCALGACSGDACLIELDPSGHGTFWRAPTVFRSDG